MGRLFIKKIVSRQDKWWSKPNRSAHKQSTGEVSTLLQCKKSESLLIGKFSNQLQISMNCLHCRVTFKYKCESQMVLFLKCFRTFPVFSITKFIMINTSASSQNTILIKNIFLDSLENFQRQTFFWWVFALILWAKSTCRCNKIYMHFSITYAGKTVCSHKW